MELSYWTQSLSKPHYMGKRHTRDWHFNLRLKDMLTWQQEIWNYKMRRFGILRNTSQFSSVQSLSRVWLFVTPWTAARQASLSITNSWSLFKLMSIESAMPSSHLIFHRLLLILPSVFSSTRVFSNELALGIRWPKYWSFSFSISPSNKCSGLISCRIDWLDLLAVQGILKCIL